MVLSTVYCNRKQNWISKTKETWNKDIPMHCYRYISKGLMFSKQKAYSTSQFAAHKRRSQRLQKPQ
jgi:hypothetical protein